jgi:hypothetical protein
MRHKYYRWKSSLVMKGEVVTHQLDCAVAGSAASALTSPAFVAALSVSCSSCAWLPSVSQITRYFVKVRLVGRALGGGPRGDVSARFLHALTIIGPLCAIAATSHGS